MEKLQLDTGVKRYKVGAGVLAFNPTDPNLYSRFMTCLQELEEAEKTLPASPLESLQQADKAVKAALSRVFPGNDMEAIFQGISLLAVGSNGETVLTNFLHSLEPVLRQGAVLCAKAQAARL